MFCTQCGAQNPEGANSCTNCGATFATETPATGTPVTFATETPATETPASEPKKTGSDFATLIDKLRESKYFIPGVLGAAGLALLVLLIVVLTASGGGQTKPIDKYWNAIAKTNVDKYMSAFPEEYTEDWDDDDVEDNLEDMLDNLKDVYGRNIKISIKVLDKEKYDEDELEDLRDSIEWYDLDDDELTAAYRIALKVTFKGSKDKGSNIVTFIVIKYDGKWCMHPTYAY